MTLSPPRRQKNRMMQLSPPEVLQWADGRRCVLTVVTARHSYKSPPSFNPYINRAGGLEQHVLTAEGYVEEPTLRPPYCSLSHDIFFNTSMPERYPVSVKIFLPQVRKDCTLANKEVHEAILRSTHLADRSNARVTGQGSMFRRSIDDVGIGLLKVIGPVYPAAECYFVVLSSTFDPQPALALEGEAEKITPVWSAGSFVPRGRSRDRQTSRRQGGYSPVHERRYQPPVRMTDEMMGRLPFLGHRRNGLSLGSIVQDLRNTVTPSTPTIDQNSGQWARVPTASVLSSDWSQYESESASESSLESGDDTSDQELFRPESAPAVTRHIASGPRLHRPILTRGNSAMPVNLKRMRLASR